MAQKDIPQRIDDTEVAISQLSARVSALETEHGNQGPVPADVQPRSENSLTDLETAKVRYVIDKYFAHENPEPLPADTVNENPAKTRSAT